MIKEYVVFEFRIDCLKNVFFCLKSLFKIMCFVVIDILLLFCSFLMNDVIFLYIF